MSSKVLVVNILRTCSGQGHAILPSDMAFHSRRGTQGLLYFAACLLCASAPSAAQSLGPEPPAHVGFVSGQAILERGSDAIPLEVGLPLVAGDRVRTTAGRAQLLDAASLLHLDAHSTIALQPDDVWVLENGRLHLATTAVESSLLSPASRVRSGMALIRLEEPGEYDLLRSSLGDVLVTVWRGTATLRTPRAIHRLESGVRYLVQPDSPPVPVALRESASRGEFLRWVRQRVDERLQTGRSPPLDGELALYGSTLEEHGTWQQDAVLGPIWYPTVAMGWTPYSSGRWMPTPSLGATWIGAEPWSWPTHHYGRWGIRGRSWYWRPGDDWSPGWVRWAVAPAVVGWCALGPDERPVAALPAGTDLFLAGDAYEPRGPWRFSTVGPRDQLRQGARSPGRTHGRRRPAFVTQDASRRGQDRPSTSIVRIAGSGSRERHQPDAAPGTPSRRPAASLAGSSRLESPARSIPPRRIQAGAPTERGRLLPLLGRGLPVLAPATVGRAAGSRRVGSGRTEPDRSPQTRSAPPSRAGRRPASTPSMNPTRPVAGSRPARPGSNHRPTSAGLAVPHGPQGRGTVGSRPVGSDLFRTPGSAGDPAAIRRKQQ